ncbi:MAG: ankyrin repeat domain-containing protein [Mariniblastus sp.]|nr:ankyrin repeat domain-containing protein [Mariniblastus sp.]
MKHLLITTIAALLLVGCDGPQQSAPVPDAKPVEPNSETQSAKPETSKQLHDAVAKGDSKVVKQLLANGANVDAKNAGGETVLNQAVFNSHKEIVELLIDQGANVNEKYDSGETPLHLAVHLDNQEMVELLIKKGADINARTSSGFLAETALDRAMITSEIVDLLRKHGGQTAAELEAEKR